MKIAVFAVTEKGRQLSQRLKELWPGQIRLFDHDGGTGELCEGTGALRSAVETAWKESQGLVFVTAAGIAVRLCAPLLESKAKDPAVVVVDDRGTHAISLVSGHGGGGNDLARKIAVMVGAEPVITTATDVSGQPAFDTLAAKARLRVENPDEIKRVTSVILSRQPVALVTDESSDWWKRAVTDSSVRVIQGSNKLPDGFAAYVAVTDRDIEPASGLPTLLLRPARIVAGVGCRRGASQKEIESALSAAVAELGLSMSSIGALATIDLKRGEQGLRQVADALGVPLTFYSKAELALVGGTKSEKVESLIGVGSVCEPAALLAANGGSLIMEKRKNQKVTVALAKRADSPVYSARGKIMVVGVGPGSHLDLTLRARLALEEADVIVGYRSYMERLGSQVKGKRTIAYRMGQELERCREAIQLATGGFKVALVSGGDPGIFGMAGPLLEILSRPESHEETTAEIYQGRLVGSSSVTVEVIPGVSAFCAVAAALGAPLMTDFALISLSDILTRRQTIERRLEEAAAGDLVIVLYNPASQKRTGPIKRAWCILLKHRSPKTPVGMVRKTSLPGEETVLTNLGEAEGFDVDMSTTIVVGNSNSYVSKRQGADQELLAGGSQWMVTPRGYRVPDGLIRKGLP